MTELTWQNEWFTWGMGLIVGFPLAIVALGEVIHRLGRSGRPLAETVALVRNLVLPVLAFLVFFEKVLGLNPEGEFVKIAQTVFWICAINTLLSLANVVLFGKAKEGTWRARMPKLLIDLSRLLLILVGSAIVLAVVWDADLAGLATALGVGSVVIGLALQGTLGSVVSGIALLFERPFNVGDWLQIGETQGQVVDINWRAVRLQSKNNDLVILPHEAISSEIIRNFSQPARAHLEAIDLGFAYDDPPNRVKQILKTTALATPGILKSPEPQCLLIAYEDSAITYAIQFSVEDYQSVAQVRDRFLSSIWYAARRNHLKPYRFQYEASFEPAFQANHAFDRVIESLQSMPLFTPLVKNLAHLETLAKEVEVQCFGAGETILQRGDLVEVFYIFVSGQATIEVETSDGNKQGIFTLDRGDFFGTTGRLIEPSQVSIVAMQDLELMVLGSDLVSQIFQDYPSVAREVGQTIETRRKAIAIAKQDGIASALPVSSGQSVMARWMLSDLLRQVSFFASFSEGELRQLIEQGYRKTLRSGEIICRENDPGDSFYVILSGSVEVFVESIGKRVAVRQAGEFIGEMSLLLGVPRTATLNAIGKTVLFVIDQTNLQSLLKQYQGLADQISEELAKRQENLERIGIKLEVEGAEGTATDQVRKRIQSIFGI